jgi:CRISPR-associated protein Csa1
MHYLAILYEKTARALETPQSPITLRGYDPKTWIPPELSDVKLPVYAIAYAPCPTFRDIYLERVTGIELPVTWKRYQGKLIDEVYKSIHHTSLEYVTKSKAKNFDLYNELVSNREIIIEEAKRKYQRDFRNIISPPGNPEIENFYNTLQKIIRFEAELTSSTINFEIARTRNANPNRIFNEIFDFNTDLSLNPRHQGLNSPATPDFIFRHKIIGDIKSGTWRKFFEYTAIAYALAYEDHTNQNMDYGVVLHVELPSSCLIPVHYECEIEYLSDHKRKRFLAVRNRKFEIIKSQQDPGKVERIKCDPECQHLLDCWGNGS